MNRPTHTKSRTGCRTCKARKIKCGEERPICRNCIKHGANCDFSNLKSRVSRSPVVASPLEPNPPSPSPSTWSSMLELELLHHYTISTSLTLSKDPQMRTFWRINAPQIGFSNPFVLKSILALSALHCARLKPSQERFYVAQASSCHNESSSAMQHVSSVNAENYPALLLFTLLNTYYAFARPRESSDILVIDNGLVPDWLVLFRGVRGMKEAGDSTQAYLVELLNQSGATVNQIWEASTYESDALAELQSSFDGSFSSPRKLEALRGAIKNLQRSYGFVFEGNQPEEHRLRSAFMWLYKMSDDYVELLKEVDNDAFCILAYFCVLLQRLDYWWMDGWAWHLIGNIYNLLSPESRFRIQWPIEEIGWAQVL